MKNRVIVQDERTNENIGKASTIALGVAIIYSLIEAVYKYITTKDISNCSWEIGLIVVTSLVFYIASRSKYDADLPKTFMGSVLPTGLNKKDKSARIKSYCFEGVVFAVGMVVFDVVGAYFVKDDAISFQIVTNNSVLNWLITFATLFLISTIFDYIAGELAVKKYNRLNEDEDNVE